MERIELDYDLSYGEDQYWVNTAKVVVEDHLVTIREFNEWNRSRQSIYLTIDQLKTIITDLRNNGVDV